MKKIIEMIPHLNKTAGDFGIEIETEGSGIRAVVNDVWNTVADGSLRGHYPEEAAEFVLQKPVKYGGVKPALEHLIEQQAKAKFDFSFRTSVHVHLNVQQLTELQLMNIIYTYLLVEELMVNFCGKERVSNRFCLRLQDAEGLMDVLSNIFQSGLYKSQNSITDNIRYASLNLTALRKYGSLEFRGMRGTMDIAVLMKWIDAINQIRIYALSKKNPWEIYEDYQKKSYEKFITAVFGDVTDDFIYEGYGNDLDRSFSLSIELPNLYKIYYADKAEVEEKVVLEKKPNWADIAAQAQLNAIPVPRMPRGLARDIGRPRPARPQVAAVPVDFFNDPPEFVN